MIRKIDVVLWGSLIGSAFEDGGRIVFSYDRDFADSHIEVSPLMMPLSKSVYFFPGLNEDTFHGLPGLLADSLPDKFGNAVIRNYLSSNGIPFERFGALDYLGYIGKRGMGALEFMPSTGPEFTAMEKIDVDRMVELASLVLKNRESLKIDSDDASLSQLLKFGTSAGGARAKAIIAYNEGTGEICSGQIRKGDGFSYWIMKFDDVERNGDHGLQDSKSYTRIEYAYYLMAKAAGIGMSECRLYEENGRAHFMTRRFDRNTEDGSKIHMQTLGSLAHLDYKTPRCCSYEMLVDICRRMKLQQNDIEKVFRVMVFNYLARNCDDHVKNFSFLMDKSGEWHLAPFYDITYSYNPASFWIGEHQMTANGKSKDATFDDFMECAKHMSIRKAKAKNICDEVVSALKSWGDFADIAGIDIEIPFLKF